MTSWQSMTLSLPTVTEDGRKEPDDIQIYFEEPQMIDNPLPDQVMAEKDQIHLDRNFEDLCKIHGVEIAKHYKVHPDLHVSLVSGITTTCLRIPTCLHGCIHLDESCIRDWWTDNSYLYDDSSPYQRTKFKRLTKLTKPTT